MFSAAKILSYIFFPWIIDLYGGFTFALREVDDALIAACTSQRGEDDVDLVVKALEKVRRIILQEVSL